MYRWLALFCAVLTWPLISFGALVRLKGAGLACPDWPLCYGKLIPPKGTEIAFEVGHRFVASILGLLIIGLVVLAIRSPKLKEFKGLSWSVLFLVVFQGILGWLTVSMKLNPFIVTFHLVGGNLLFLLLIYIAYAAFKKETIPKLIPRYRPEKPISKLFVGLTILVFIMLISGGANSTTYSGYSCDGFPGCYPTSFGSFGLGGETGTELQAPSLSGGGQPFFPEYSNGWIHMTHRAVVIVGAGILLFFGVRLLKTPGFAPVGALLMITVAAELTLGVLTAIYRVPVPFATAHTAGAATLVGITGFGFVKSIYE